MTYILGISGFYHDSSVCLVENGRVKAFIKEEWLTRVKGSNGFPSRSLEYLKDKYFLSNSNIDAVAFYEKPLEGWSKLLGYFLRQPKSSKELIAHQAKQFWLGPLSFKVKFAKQLKIDSKKFLFAPHHLSHVMSSQCYMPRNIYQNPPLHFVFDAVGDGKTISVFRGMHAETELVYQNEFPNSLGLFYSALAQICGYAVNEGEYKFMALAPFGDSEQFKPIFENLFQVRNGDFILDMDWFSFDKQLQYGFSDKLANSLGGAISENELSLNSQEFKRASNIAASSQRVLENVISQTVELWVSEFKPNAISISGGVAQNTAAMATIANEFENLSITIPPSPGDSGAALGAANYANLIINGTGIAVEDLAFEVAIPSRTSVTDDIFLPLSTNIEEATLLAADLIAKGEHLCIFSNQIEIGPRALGHRSIVCSARDKHVVKSLNENIKKREKYRPLSPVCLHETAKRYFNISERWEQNLKWMGLLVHANEHFPEEYNAALHVDGSARLQIVNDKAPLLKAILATMEREHDILINTSFNIAGDPIVFDLIDAFTNMKRMNLKYILRDDGLFYISENF